MRGLKANLCQSPINFCFDPKWCLRSLLTHIRTGYLPSPPPNVKKTKWNLWIHWTNWSETMWRRGEGFFACLPSLVKLMANIQDSGGKMFKVLLSQVLWSVQHTSLVRLWRLVWLVLIILTAPSGLTVRLRAVQSIKFSGLLAFFRVQIWQNICAHIWVPKNGTSGARTKILRPLL